MSKRKSKNNEPRTNSNINTVKTEKPAENAVNADESTAKPEINSSEQPADEAKNADIKSADVKADMPENNSSEENLNKPDDAVAEAEKEKPDTNKTTVQKADEAENGTAKPSANGKAERRKNRRKTDISETGDQTVEITDNALDESTAKPEINDSEKPDDEAKNADVKADMPESSNSEEDLNKPVEAVAEAEKDKPDASENADEKTDKEKNEITKPAAKGKAKKEKNRKKIDISETGDQMMEIIDDALDESTEDLGLTDETSLALSNASVGGILTVIFGLVVLCFAIFGAITAIVDIKNYSDAKKANLEKIEFFENLILPLCASDAPTFDGASSLNGDVAIAAACWDIILSPASNYTAENGYYTISCHDIDIRINKLFGKGVTYTHTTIGDQEISFEYDEESGMYTIPAYPRILAYFPTVDSLEPIENGYKLTVSYHYPVTNWITAKNPTDKIMIYTVTGSGLAYNISAIEVGEIFNTQNL